MTKLFDNGKIMIDFDKILCFYIKNIFPKLEESLAGRTPYSNLIIIIGNKIGEPKVIEFLYSQNFITKDNFEIDYIGKQIHNELLNYFKNDN